MIDDFAFLYPEARKSRRHGPVYKKGYPPYRPWLRDEFMFRCIYCLKRETWGQVTGEFELDHFQPKNLHPEKKLEYKNLVYACQRCNKIKSSKKIPDPFTVLNKDRLFCDEEGYLNTDDPKVECLIEHLDLNSPKMVQFRWKWLRIVMLAKEGDSALFMSLMGLPADLPDLSRRKPVSNSRKKGISESWFCRRQKGGV